MSCWLDCSELAPEADGEGLGDLDDLAIRWHCSDFVDRFRERYVLNVGRSKGHHHSVFARSHCAYSPGSVTQTELAVDCGWSAAPDPGTQDEGISFLSDQQL